MVDVHAAARRAATRARAGGGSGTASGARTAHAVSTAFDSAGDLDLMVHMLFQFRVAETGDAVDSTTHPVRGTVAAAFAAARRGGRVTTGTRGPAASRTQTRIRQHVTAVRP